MMKAENEEEEPMKRLGSMILVLLLVAAAMTVAAAENVPSVRIGVLTMLNATEADYTEMIEARSVVTRVLAREGYASVQSQLKPMFEGNYQRKIRYYDSLDSMMMASHTGDVRLMDVLQSVGRYICANNDDFVMGIEFDTEKERTQFVERVMSGPIRGDLSFLMMQDHEQLRDEFNEAIAAMKEDGTLDRLVKEQIENVISGGEIVPVQMEKIEGAPVLTVAVTGCLPPIDYVDAGGKAAGFNTAVLAEIGKRIGRNIQVVVVDSLGRAAALASGAVDVVFWTRGNRSATKASTMTDEELEKSRESLKTLTPDNEQESMKEYFSHFGKKLIKLLHAGDQPEGTVVTESYFSDFYVPVFSKSAVAKMEQ